MRTTITFDDDTTATLQRFRRERGMGISAAVNELVRRGIARREPARKFIQRTSAGHARIDVTNVAEALEVLDWPTTR